MKYSVRYFSLLLIITFSFGGFAQAQKAVKDKDLPNFGRINANLFRGGQPTGAGLEKLKDVYNVKSIVYLRGADEKAEIEKNRAKAVGIELQSFSLNNWLRPKDAQIKDILAFIDNPANQPVFVHCKRGADRTGTIVAVYRIAREGKTAKEAFDEAKDFHFGWWQIWMKDYINDYYRDFRKVNSEQ
ncbi:MAG: tyrosine-protein phosphatase [Pyrinomonadaceae bacterium]